MVVYIRLYTCKDVFYCVALYMNGPVGFALTLVAASLEDPAGGGQDSGELPVITRIRRSHRGSALTRLSVLTA